MSTAVVCSLRSARGGSGEQGAGCAGGPGGRRRSAAGAHQAGATLGYPVIAPLLSVPPCYVAVSPERDAGQVVGGASEPAVTSAQLPPSRRTARTLITSTRTPRAVRWPSPAPIRRACSCRASMSTLSRARGSHWRSIAAVSIAAHGSSAVDETAHPEIASRTRPVRPGQRGQNSVCIAIKRSSFGPVPLDELADCLVPVAPVFAGIWRSTFNVGTLVALGSPRHNVV